MLSIILELPSNILFEVSSPEDPNLIKWNIRSETNFQLAKCWLFHLATRRFAGQAISNLMVTSDVAEEVIEKDNVKAQDGVKDNFFGFEHKQNQVRFGKIQNFLAVLDSIKPK